MIPSIHGNGIALNLDRQKKLVEAESNVVSSASDSEGESSSEQEKVQCDEDIHADILPTRKLSATDFSTHFVVHRHSQSPLDDKDDLSHRAGPGVDPTFSKDDGAKELSTSGATCKPATEEDVCKPCDSKGESCIDSQTPARSLPTFTSRKAIPRVQHPFMKSPFMAISKGLGLSDLTPKSFLRKTVKMPASPMDSCYEPVAAFCIQKMGPRRVSQNEQCSDPESNDCVTELPAQSPRIKVLETCGQRSPIPLDTIFNELRNLKKIGEGVYGEVYSGSFRCLTDYNWVYKIVAIEGDKLVNGERPRKFAEILPEIIVSQKLNLLRNGYKNCQTDGYVFMRNARIATGTYPKRLVKAWEEYNEEYESDNDKPEFPENQLYMVLEFEFAGQDIESIIFKDARQSLSIILQVAHILAVGECAFEFEHRDLHWGNVMVETHKEPTIPFTLNGQTLRVPSRGGKVVVIDFTVSRLKDGKEPVICLDLEDDEEQFLGTGDHQFDIYRMTRDFNRNQWQKYSPKSNIFWLHYLALKFSVKATYKESRTGDGEGDDNRASHHKKGLENLINFSHSILDYDSASEFVRNAECKKYKKFLISVLQPKFTEIGLF